MTTPALTAQTTLAHYQREAAHAAELAELRQLREEVARLREVNAALVEALEQAEMDIGVLFFALPSKDHHLATTAKSRILATLAANKGA